MNENKEFWALNSVIFKKPYDLEKAHEEAKKFITSGSKKRPRETKTSYRFRNLNKQKFIKGSFKTKKINKNISLVFGQLKPEYNHLEGAGFFDFIKKPINAVRNFFSPRQGLNNTSTNTLKTYGSSVIDGLTIARTPINSMVDKAINLISFGKWNQLKKEYKFDELFHLALIAKIGGKNIIIEKNEVINISTNYKMNSETETLDVPLNGKRITLDELIEKTKSYMGSNFIPYDGFKNNCQFFIRGILEANGLYGEREKDFLFQDLEELSKKMPWLSKKIMNLTTNTGAIVNKIMGKGEPTKINLTKLDDLTVKNLRQIAKAFNEHLLIENIYTMNKKDLIQELEKHLEIFEGELRLTPYIFEILKKNKNKSEIEIEVERMKSELEKINKEYLPIAKAKEASEEKIKAEYMEKYGYPDLMKFHKQLESGVLEVGSELYKKLKNKFVVKTKNELMTYLRDHSFENFERNHPLTDYEGKNKFYGLHKQQYKLKVGSNPENVKKRLEMEKKLEELKEVEAKQKEIVKKIRKDNMEKFGEDLDYLSQKFNYFSYNEKHLSKAEKEEKVKLQNDLKKKFKLRTNNLLSEFINKNKPSNLKSENDEYSKLRDKAYKLWLELTKMPQSPYYNSNNYYGYGKIDLGTEFKMDTEDHKKKLEEFEQSMPDHKTIKDVLKELKEMTNSGLTHINKLEELVGGSAKSSGFISAIMANENKKRPKEFKKYNQEGFNELKITDNKLSKASGDMVRRKFKNEDYKKFITFLSFPNAVDLYNNNEMRDLFLKDEKKAKEAIGQVEDLIYNKKNMEEAILKKFPTFNELDGINKEVIRHQYKQAVIASIMSKYYNKLEPITAEITIDMINRIKESQRLYRLKKKGKKGKEPEFNNEEFKEYWNKVKNLKKGEEMENFLPKAQPATKKEKEEGFKELEAEKKMAIPKGGKEMTREEIDKELKKKLKEFKAIVKKNDDLKLPIKKVIKKPKFDYNKPSKEQLDINNALREWMNKKS